MEKIELKMIKEVLWCIYFTRCIYIGTSSFWRIIGTSHRQFDKYTQQNVRSTNILPVNTYINNVTFQQRCLENKNLIEIYGAKLYRLFHIAIPAHRLDEGKK